MEREQIEKAFPDIKIVHTYPESGQKYVFLIIHATFGRTILKVVKDMNPRFEREIDIARQYHLSHIPKILDVGTKYIKDRHYNYVIEQYIDGNSLKEELKVNPFTLKRSVDLLESLLLTAIELEDNKIVHRDIKPDNIICCVTGEYYLIDFGIARILNADSLTFTGVAIGPHTPGYGAPELFQYSKVEIDSRADLFSIGIVVYETIFRKHPFITGNETNVREIWFNTANVNPDGLSINGDDDRQLISFIQTLMQKHISRRPPTAHTALGWFEIVKSSLKF